MSLLEINNLTIEFRTGRQCVLVVNNVSLQVEPGESVGLVGESGSGKSTIANAILHLVAPTSGTIMFEGKRVDGVRGSTLTQFRQRVQMIFQDPYGSLNPRMTVGSTLEEVLTVHRIGSRQDRRRRVLDLMNMVGLSDHHAGRYPHEFSGGQRQRIGIARALALNPALIIADEPVSALDVSVQAQILNLMKDLQTQQKMAYLFIAHDLAVVRYLCQRVLVMYMGQIMESAPTEELFEHPAHPYTKMLLAAVPDVDAGLVTRHTPRGAHPDKGGTTQLSTQRGCPFAPRCPRAEPICSQDAPPNVPVSPTHTSRCHFAG